MCTCLLLGDAWLVASQFEMMSFCSLQTARWFIQAHLTLIALHPSQLEPNRLFFGLWSA